jgi:hypothetical protein
MIGALAPLSASDRQIVGVIIRRVAEVEDTRGADAADNMLGALERALFRADGD